MMKKMLMIVVLVAAYLGSTALIPAQPAAASSTISSAAMSSWYKQRARMTSSGRMKGKADYRDRPKKGTIEQRLKIQVEKADPNTQFDVFFNGDFLGTLTTNSFGRGKLQFRTAQFNDDPNRPDLPENFPRIIDGDEIEVGPAHGVFELK